MDERFACKETEWLAVGEDLDYLGQEVILTPTHLHLSMFKYIQDLIDLVELRQVDRSAAKTKLKHIDCRQEWVKVLRNKDILKPVHVDSKDNVADLFTKILSRGVFERLRDLIMVPLDRTCDPRDTSLDRDSDDEISLDSEWDDY